MSNHPSEGMEEHPTRRVDPMRSSVLSREPNSRVVTVRGSDGEDEQADPGESWVCIVELLLVLPGKEKDEN